MKCSIKNVNDIIDLKMKEVNERLNMYFHVSDPFFGFYNPDEGSNSGIVINVRTETNETKSILSNFPPEEQDDKMKEEKKYFKEFLEKRNEYFKQYKSMIYWQIYYDGSENTFKLNEKIHYARCAITTKNGIEEKLEIIKKENPNSEELKKIFKKEKIKKLYNIVEFDSKMYEFIDSEINRIINVYLKENKLNVEEKINQVVNEAIEHIKQKMYI